VDEILGPFLGAASEQDAARELEKLFVEHITPVSREASRRYLRSYGGNDWADRGEEVQAEVALRLTARLRELRIFPEPIENFRAYVTSAVFNAAYARVRRRCPKRVQLQNRIRYLLLNYNHFALWQSSSGEWLAGYSKWYGRDEACALPPLRAHGELAEILRALFQDAGGALRLSDVVAGAAEALGVRDETPVRIADEEPAAPHVPLDSQLVARERLSQLWAEVRELPERQRAALLLNLRDEEGHGVIELLPAMGIASIRQIADAAGMDASRFAALWNDLPLADATIAEMFGITRQQVINLRKSARQRLSRRIGPASGNTAADSASQRLKVVRLG
jgi:DNA-directed RNA polymerase specialized sigma24 family protein